MSHYPNRSGWHQERRSRRLLLVALAFAASFVLHLFLMMTVSDWHLEKVTITTDQPAEPRPPLEVEHLDFDPLRALANPDTGHPEDGAGVGVPREELSGLARLPDPALTAPPPRTSEQTPGTLVDPQAAPRLPTAIGWQPRQEIVAIVDHVVHDEVAMLLRREIVPLERVARAPDYVPAVDATRDYFGSGVAPAPPPPPASTVAADESEHEAPTAEPSRDNETTEIATDETTTPDAAIHRFGETPGDVTEYEAIDSRLMIRTEVYAPEGPAGHHYFALQIMRRDAAELPVVPKDIVFLQDSSRSLAEERLYFCRQALKSIVTQLNPLDRFNVIRFSGKPQFCFSDWTHPSPDAVDRATLFVDAMRAEGATDIFATVRSLQNLPRDPARPLIAIIITDGQATTGLTATTDIIGQFTRSNTNNIAVYALGTHGRANNYLLDLLSYCNRGIATVVTSGRWDIQREIEALATGVADPVLGNLTVMADSTSQADLQPLPAAHLYASRPLELYGMTPPGVTNLVLQVRGAGGAAKCDVIFQVDLTRGIRGGEALRKGWARRKMHSLVGNYARRREAATLREMRQLGLRYNLPIPYSDQLQEHTE